MKSEKISDKQAISLVVLFIYGEFAILMSGLSGEKDLWLSIIIAMIMILPLMLLYSKLFNIFPNKNLFEIIELYFGKIIGKIIIIGYTWYAFDLAVLVLRDFGNFGNTVNFPDTPIIVPMLFIMILCAWIVKEGIEVMGRWGEFFLIIPTSLLFIVGALLIPRMNLENITPVLQKGIEPVFKGAYEVFIYPFGETIIFTAAFSTLKNKKSIYKVYIKGLLFGAMFLLIISIVNILVLGIEDTLNIYFPGYSTVAKVNIANTLQRIEAVAATVYLLGGFIKISVYLLAACKGIAKIFETNNYRFIVVPISLLVVNVGYFEFDNVMSFNQFIFDVWIYYAFVFMVILPIFIFITTAIKKKPLIKQNTYE